MEALQEHPAGDFRADQETEARKYFVYFGPTIRRAARKDPPQAAAEFQELTPTKNRIANGKAAMRSWYQGTLLALSLRRHDPDQVHG